MRALFVVPFLLFSTLFLYAQPIPLVENSYRIHNDSLQFPLVVDSVHPFWQVQNISVSAYNSSYWSKDSYLKPNRFILHLQDSLSFEKIDLTFRARIDQIGHDAYDASWKHDSIPNVIFDVEKLYFTVTPNEYLHFGVGKERFNWGPNELGGLLVSDYNQGFVALYQEYRFGAITLRGIATQINSLKVRDSITGGTSVEKRYFSAAKVEFYRDRFGIALGQSVLYGGEGRSFELGYVVPFMPFHFVQLANNDYGNLYDNTFASGDFYVNWFDKRLELYGELLIDDFRASDDSTSKTIQNAMAFMAGVRYKSGNGLFAFFEGGQINSYVYNHIAGDRLRYVYNDGLMGSPLGPDQQLFWGQVGHTIGSHWSVDLTSWFRRSGERTIDTDFDYKTNAQDSRFDPIPYGTVEGEFANWITGKFRYNSFEASLVGGFAHYFNREHVEGSTATYPFLGLTLQSGLKLKWKDATE